MTRVPSWAGAPVLSKMRPPRRTRVPSGPRGPGGTGTRRGSSDVGVSALRYFRRSCNFCCPGSAGEIRKRITLAAANAFQNFLIANREIILSFPRETRGVFCHERGEERGEKSEPHECGLLRPCLAGNASSGRTLPDAMQKLHCIGYELLSFRRRFRCFCCAALSLPWRWCSYRSRSGRKKQTKNPRGKIPLRRALPTSSRDRK